MKKHAIEAATALTEFKSRYEGRRCHAYTQEIIDRTEFDYWGHVKKSRVSAVKGTQEFCRGFFVVSCKKRSIWVHNRYTFEYELKEGVRVLAKCPECGLTYGSKWYSEE